MAISRSINTPLVRPTIARPSHGVKDMSGDLTPRAQPLPGEAAGHRSVAELQVLRLHGEELLWLEPLLRQTLLVMILAQGIQDMVVLDAPVLPVLRPHDGRDLLELSRQASD